MKSSLDVFNQFLLLQTVSGLLGHHQISYCIFQVKEKLFKIGLWTNGWNILVFAFIIFGTNSWKNNENLLIDLWIVCTYGPIVLVIGNRTQNHGTFEQGFFWFELCCRWWKLKSGLEKIILKFLHAQSLFWKTSFLLHRKGDFCIKLQIQ